jgi:thiol-disulfide isomerase/thioredoxin
MIRFRSRFHFAVIALVLALRAAALAGGDWNDAQVAWQPYAEGLAAAKKSGKPICLIFYTEWCPHCQNYSRLFHDAKVVEQTKMFVMIRLDQDKEKDLSGRYSPDGGYIPRTMFLSPAGELDKEIKARDGKYAYFYDERNPAPLLEKMEVAQKKYPARGFFKKLFGS